MSGFLFDTNVLLDIATAEFLDGLEETGSPSYWQSANPCPHRIDGNSTASLQFAGRSIGQITEDRREFGTVEAFESNSYGRWQRSITQRKQLVEIRVERDDDIAVIPGIAENLLVRCVRHRQFGDMNRSESPLSQTQTGASR